MKNIVSLFLSLVILTGCSSTTTSITANSQDAQNRYSNIKFQALSNDTFFNKTFLEEQEITPNPLKLSINNDLSNVIDINYLPNSAKDKLSSNKFVVLMNNNYAQDKIYEHYSDDISMQKFVTSDVFLHTFHVLYDFSLRLLESKHFYPKLKELTNKLLQESIYQYQAIKDNQELKELARRNIAYFAVAAVILDKNTKIPDIVKDLVEEELKLIDKHQGFLLSPIFNYEDKDIPDNLKKEDYSQYVPRGHYTRTEELKNYFKAMMWYGRINFLTSSYKRTLQAILITMALNKIEQGINLWNSIYTPTSFLVGSTDDLNIYDYTSILNKVWDKNKNLSLNDLNKNIVDKFILEVKKLPQPKINSSLVFEGQGDFSALTQGFRLMGQRFVLDSFIFQNLVHTKVTNRFMPSPLDVMAVLGSNKAMKLLEEKGETKYTNYKEQVNKLKTFISSLNITDWTQNIYYYWLYTIIPLLETKSNISSYPVFMQNDAWIDKQLNTSLSFWTELKHDTILYAKQSYTLAKSMPFQETKLNGYIEPELKLYVRLYNLVSMLEQGLRDRGLDIETLDELKELKEYLDKTIVITKKELKGEKLSETEYKFIDKLGRNLGYLASPKNLDPSGTVSNEVDTKMALVADVHTDPNSGEVLQVGIGKSYPIYVIVPNSDNKPQLVRGGVFSYYEFTQSMSNRLTDEEWQKMVEENKPTVPNWTKSYVASND